MDDLRRQRVIFAKYVYKSAHYDYYKYKFRFWNVQGGQVDRWQVDKWIGRQMQTCGHIERIATTTFNIGMYMVGRQTGGTDQYIESAVKTHVEFNTEVYFL